MSALMIFERAPLGSIVSWKNGKPRPRGTASGPAPNGGATTPRVGSSENSAILSWGSRSSPPVSK